jgi:hypothetical protein
MDINKHIVDNLNFYLGLNFPEYAFLITGEWGSGKTHFIESFIKNPKESNSKIIKVSLFGLKCTSNIDEKIFQELHPVLGSKYAKFAGNIFKGAINLGFKIDLDSDGKPDASLNSKFDKVDFSEYFSKEGRNKEIVLVIDDLERTDISTTEVLGYINYLVEISKIKVVLVANEQFILENNNSDDYKRFKEKVVGKTFEVKHNIDEVLAEFLDESEDKLLHKQLDVIRDVYTRSKCKNLRKIKQSIFDFGYLTSCISDEYLKNSMFYSNLVRTFFALSIEIKKGVLDEQSLRKNTPLRRMIEPSNEIEKIFEKYALNESYLYSGDLWAEILFKGNLESVNEVTSKLAFFINKQEVVPPTWVKLWNFKELEQEEFSSLVKEIEDDIKNLKEDSLPIYLHKLALMLYFYKNKLITIDLPIFKKSVEKYICKYESSEHWKNKVLGDNSYFNGTGYTYYNEQDEDFIELSNLIRSKNKIAYEKEQKQKEVTTSEILVSSIELGSLESLIEILLKNYESKPIFHNISPDLFVDNLFNSKNSAINKFNQVIDERFSDNKTLNNEPYYFYLRDESDFWSAIEKIIEIKLKQNQGLKKHILEQFSKHTVSKINRLLSSVSSHNA